MIVDLVIVGEPLPEMKKSLDSFSKWVNVIVEPFDEGYNKSLNNGAIRGKSQIIGFCNNDLIFHDFANNDLCEALQRYDSASPWCPKTHKQWWKGTVPTRDIVGYTTGKIVAGWCIFMRRSTWEKIGGFDERLKFYCCDNAYCEQLKSAGLKHALIPSARVTHLQSVTLNKLKNENPKKYNEFTREQIKLFNRLYKKNLFNLGK